MPLISASKRHWLTAAALAAVVAISAACTDQSTVAVSPSPIPLPSPVREARTVPQPDGSIRIEAVSAKVIPNQAYVFPVLTHCGFAAATFDFDGSFWAIAGPAGVAMNAPNPPAGIDNPIDTGLIALVGPDQAVWVSRTGMRIELVRGGTEVRTFGCD